MAEVSKSRLALDLEEIERQLRNSAQQPVSTSKSDPLAELARIVGQDDPFRALLEAETAGAGRPAQTDDIFARRDPVFDGLAYGQGAAEAKHLQPAPSPQQPAPAHGYRQHPVALTAEEEAILRGQQQIRYAQEPDDAGLYYPDSAGYADADMPYAPVRTRRSRKGLVAVGTVLGAAVLATIGVLTLRPGESIKVAGGEPPVVKAGPGPLKVAPQNPGGVDIPNQNKQIYERATQDNQTRVVNREEQPVDIRQATRSVVPPSDTASPSQARLSPGLPASPSAAGSAPLQGTGNAAAGILGEPKRVRTVSIRPDGTIVMPEQSDATRPSPTPAPPSLVMPESRAPSTSGPAPVAAASPPPAPPPGNLAPAQRPREVTAAPSLPPTLAPRAVSGTNGPDQRAGMPMQITSEAVRPRSEPRVAAAPPTIAREPTETSAAPRSGSPGFTVQLGVRNTEREARMVFEQLQDRYAEDLDGYTPLIREAEINGKTAYRLRVGPMSRDEANSLCSRLKSAGGQCFVANNQ